MRDDTPIPNRDLAAEAAVLGAMMMTPAFIPAALTAVDAADFYDLRHADIFEAIRHLLESGDATDAVGVARRLMRTGDLNRVGGHPYLHELMSLAPVSGVALKHAEAVRDCAKLRRLSALGVRLNQMGNDGATDPADVPEMLLAAIGQLEGELVETIENAVPRPADVIDEILEQVEKPQTIRTVASGLDDLDDFYPGHAPGNMVIIAARPGIGKTVLGLTMARNAANAGIRTLFVSLEMSTVEIMRRIISAEAGVPLDNITKGRCSDYDWERIAAAYGRIAAAPLYIDDRETQGLVEIRHTLSEMQRTGGVGLLVVDYIQLMAEPPRSENRQQAVSAISRGLKLMAKKFGIPIITLAQLNRDSEKRHDKRPIAADLRESGSLEQDADSIILMYREDAHNPEVRVGECDLIVEKSRHGRRGVATVMLQGHYARCVGFAREPWTPHRNLEDAA